MALAHTLGPLSNRANGVVEAMCLPHKLRYAASAVPDRVGTVAGALGLTVSAVDSVESLQSVQFRVGVPNA